MPNRGYLYWRATKSCMGARGYLKSIAVLLNLEMHNKTVVSPIFCLSPKVRP